MKRNKPSRCWVTLIIVLSLIGCHYLFTTWLHHYSSIFVIGPASKTHESSPSWSPDGKQIAYLCGFSYFSDGWDSRSFNNSEWGRRTSEICIYNLENRQTRQITKFGRDKYSPLWSPDGRILAWTDLRLNVLTFFDMENYKTLATISLDKIASPYFWSKDSQSLLSSDGRFILDISTMNISRHPWTDEFEDDVLSASEKYVAFAQKIVLTDEMDSQALEAYRKEFDDDPYIVFVMENKNVIYESNYWASSFPLPFVWSPNGDILMFEKFGTYGEDSVRRGIVFLYAPTGETALFNSDVEFPVWSPSGQKIAYKPDEDTINVVELELKTNPFSYTLIGEKSFPLNKSSMGDRFEDNTFWATLEWSPDESRIAFLKREFDYQEGEASITHPSKIWLLDLETGDQAPLIDTP